MGGVWERRPAARKLVLAGFWLTLLALVGRFVSDMVSADWPQRPLWDLGSAGPWVAFYARGIGIGSSMAAGSCMVIAAMVLAWDLLCQTLRAVRRVGQHHSPSLTPRAR
ncbi:hypothetical protein [Streptomyces sp. NPDC046161]|uniref:hypothetical protein n=1 Tax=Streptomyces sp. NPDC046161 TaxID=3155132 RepID=UPI0033E6E1AD